MGKKKTAFAKMRSQMKRSVEPMIKMQEEQRKQQEEQRKQQEEQRKQQEREIFKQKHIEEMSRILGIIIRYRNVIFI